MNTSTVNVASAAHTITTAVSRMCSTSLRQFAAADSIVPMLLARTLVLLVLLTGCNNAESSVPDMSSPGEDAAAACATTCVPTCGAGQICFGRGAVHVAACLKTCESDSDCGGLHCYAVTLEDGPVCSATPPSLCPGASTNCDPPAGFTSPYCYDANTLGAVVSAAGQAGCVSELTHCANGCQPPPDGGTASCR